MPDDGDAVGVLGTDAAECVRGWVRVLCVRVWFVVCALFSTWPLPCACRRCVVP